MIRPPAPNEKRITQAIQIAHCFRGHGSVASESDQQSLGAAANRAADVQLRVEAASARQHKRPQWLQFFVRRIDLALELLHLRICHTRLFRMHVSRQRGKDRSQIEQLMLDTLQNRCQAPQPLHSTRKLLGCRARHTDRGVQLVHRSIAVDAPVVFRNTLAAHQARLSCVARARINAVQRNSRFVKRLFAHVMILTALIIEFSHTFYNLDSVSMSIPIRVLVAKPGLDGHDRGAKVIARALRDAGMEVIYTGLRQTPEMIVNAALQEDVQVIGLSILSGAHNAIVPRIMELLREKEMSDVLVVVGGIIPDEDAAELKKLGVAEVFQPGASLEKIIHFIRESVKQVA